MRSGSWRVEPSARAIGACTSWFNHSVSPTSSASAARGSQPVGRITKYGKSRGLTPGVSCAEHEIAEFAHRSTAVRGARNVVRRGLDLVDRIAHRHREAAAAHHRQILDVIAHEGARLRVEAQLLHQALERGKLVVAGALDHVRDGKLLRALRHRPGFPAGEDRGREARFLQQLHAVAVEDVERLEHLALRVEVERAVGHHAVDVEDREPDGAGALDELHQTTPAASRSWKVRAPTSRPSGESTTRRPPRLCFSSTWAASAARRSGAMERGLRVITSATRRVLIMSCFSSVRRKSPSVKMPRSLSLSSTMHVMPMPFLVISTIAAGRSASGEFFGSRSPGRMMSATCTSRRRPSVPPGWCWAKSSLRNPLASSSATASASPSASAAVVLAVGARFSGHASFSTPASRCTSAWVARVDCARPVIAITLAPRRLMSGRTFWISSDSPE